MIDDMNMPGDEESTDTGMQTPAEGGEETAVPAPEAPAEGGDMGGDDAGPEGGQPEGTV